MEKTDALSVLRSLVARFDRNEKLALVAFTSLNCTSELGWSLKRDCFSKDLNKAFDLLSNFTKTTKLSFAIEILQSCQDAEEVTECIDSINDDDHLNLYCYDGIPLLGED